MQSKFTKWRKENHRETGGFELKISKEGKAIAYSAFQSQQLPSLYKTKHDCLFYKIPDVGYDLKPYDAVLLCFSPAWVVLGWHHMGKGIYTYMVDIDVFLAEQASSTRKSITEQRARELASKHFILT